jgi:cyanophycinase
MFPLFLIGGGWAPDMFNQTYGAFVKAATSRNYRRIAMILGVEEEADKPIIETKYRAVFGLLGLTSDELAVIWVSADCPLKLETLRSCLPSGVFVGGGLTPLYQESMCKDPSWLDYLRQRRIPYAGFSAGAAITARQAIVGGWKVKKDGQDVEILDADYGENLEMLEVRPGLGLVPYSIDVHASQWGTLTRLIQAIDLELTDAGWAIDENTMIHIEEDRFNICGRGHAYFVERQIPGKLLKLRICHPELLINLIP